MAAVFGVQLHHGVPGGAGAGEKVQHDVVGARRLLQQALDQRKRLGVREGLVAEDRLDLVGGHAAAAATQEHHRLQRGLIVVADVLVHAGDPAAQGRQSFALGLGRPVLLA